MSVPFFRHLFAAKRLFWALGGLVAFYLAAYAVPVLLPFAQVAAGGLAAAGVIDLLLLWRGAPSPALTLHRAVPDRLSNGDDNPLAVRIESRYPFAVRVRLLDEVPVQFQARHLDFNVVLPPGAARTAHYTLRPTARGVYAFGATHAYVASPVGLFLRRFRQDAPAEVPVYPSFLQMHRFAFLATSNRLAEVGIKKVRRVGHTMEFDQIRAYVPGDDRRTVNWKATARRADLMVNTYQDERSQPVYAALDLGRAMRSPFAGMTLVDYAINAALVLLNVALLKADRASLVTFDAQIQTVLPPSRNRTQLPLILEALYHQKPGFQEPNYEALYALVRTQLRQRGLFLLFTNLETKASLERRLPLLQRIARSHRLVVIFFENTDLDDLRHRPAERAEDVYLKTTAAQFDLEKREIVRTLEQAGIHTVLTTPQSLTVDTLNRYLELKARGLG